jgi:peptidyl-prolyl cis-trans isomerase C
LGPPETAKAQLLQDLVQRALLLEAAKAKGLDRDTMARRVRRNAESEILSSTLLERAVAGPVPVSEAEARRWYEWRGVEAHLQLVYAPSRERADAALGEIRRGADFGEVADRYSLAGAIPPGGDLGMVAPGSLIAPLDRYVREAPIGEITGPVQSPGEGWFVLRVIERKPREQPPYDTQRQALMEMLSQRKQRLLSVRAFRKLRDQYRVRVEPAGAHILYQYYNHPARLGGGEAPEPSQAELKQVLARYDDARGRPRAYTMGDALDDLDRGGERPNLTVLPSFEQWIESRVVLKTVEVEAGRRHLQEEPAVRARIDERVNDYLLDSIYSTAILQNVTVTPEDVRVAYRRQAAVFSTLNSIQVQYLVIPDSSAASNVLDHVRQAKTLKDAILLSSPGMSVREETVRFPTTDPDWSALESELRAVPIGSYGGPVSGRGGWIVYQVVARDETTPTFESLPPDVQMELRSIAQNAAVERRLAQFTDSLRTVIPVRIARTRLQEIPWPPPGAMSLGQSPARP